MLMTLAKGTARWAAVAAFCLAFSYVLVEGLDRQLANEQATYSYSAYSYAPMPYCHTDCECEGC